MVEEDAKDLQTTVASQTADDVRRCQQIMAHAWMVRTFVKHSPEIEEFPELMGIVRGVFDLSRALETRADDPPEYFKMLWKKLSGLRQASEQFAIDAPVASTHTNYQQAVISIAACVEDLQQLLNRNYRPPTPLRSPQLPSGKPPTSPLVVPPAD